MPSKGQKVYMQDQSRRATLRARTSPAHEALDKMIGPFDSPASYRRYLQGMAAFRAAVEATLFMADWPAALSDWQNERLSPLIAQDLDDLDLAVPTFSAPSFGGLNTEDLLGMLYVLEGSALGARLLYKRAQALGYGETFGARHLAVQSRQSGRWGVFLKLLEDAPLIDIEKVAKASTQTFGIAEKAFERALHEHA